MVGSHWSLHRDMAGLLERMAKLEGRVDILIAVFVRLGRETVRIPILYAETGTMPKTTTKPKPPKDDLRYEPTKAELEEDVRIDATFDELVDAMFGRRPHRTAH